MPTVYRIFAGEKYLSIEVAASEAEAVALYLQAPNRPVLVDAIRAVPYDVDAARYRVTLETSQGVEEIEVDALAHAEDHAVFCARRTLCATEPDWRTLEALAVSLVRAYPLGDRVVPFTRPDRET
jgi:hypothetical protein